jgi:hypothetical protein
MASPFAKLTVHKDPIIDSGGISPGGQPIQISIDISADSSSTVATYLRCLELFNRQFEKGLHAAKAEMAEETLEGRVPSTPVSLTFLRQVITEGNAKAEIIRSGDLIPLTETSQHAAEGFDDKNLREWLQTGRIFALSHEGINYIPAYAFDNATRQPLVCLEAVVAVLKTQNDGWGMAFWFASPNNFLGGRPPKDLLLSHPGRVLVAALEEAGGDVMHG